MKKVLTLCLVLVMALCMSVTAFAAPNGFTRSPGANSAPTVENFDPEDEDCTADLIITPFGDLSKLPEEMQQRFQEAYDSIVNADDLTKLNEELEKNAKEKGIDPDNIGISDLFNIHCEGCDNHEGHDKAGITLSAETLNNFLGLMFMDEDGKWQWVKDAAVNANGKLEFTATNTNAPYAIVVDTTEAGTGNGDPGTGEGFGIYFWIAIASTAALLIVLVLILIKKKRA